MLQAHCDPRIALALGELNLIQRLWWALSNQLVEMDLNARLAWQRVCSDEAAYEEFQACQDEVWELLTSLRSLSAAIDGWRREYPVIWWDVSKLLNPNNPGDLYFPNAFGGVTNTRNPYPN